MVFYPYQPNSNTMFESFVSIEDISQITPSIYLSGYRGANNLKELNKRNIKYVINCTNTLPNYFENDISECGCVNTSTESQSTPANNIVYLRLPIDDTYDQSIEKFFDTTYNLIEKSIKEKKSILVHCYAGMSRSSTILIAYFMRKNKMTFKEAFEFVKSKRSIVEPNPDFRKSLLAFEKRIM
jgi:hypothetical protein